MTGKKKGDFGEFMRLTDKGKSDLYHLVGGMMDVSKMIKHFRSKPGGEMLLLLALSFVVAEMMQEE